MNESVQTVQIFPMVTSRFFEDKKKLVVEIRLSNFLYPGIAVKNIVRIISIVTHRQTNRRPIDRAQPTQRIEPQLKCIRIFILSFGGSHNNQPFAIVFVVFFFIFTFFCLISITFAKPTLNKQFAIIEFAAQDAVEFSSTLR